MPRVNHPATSEHTRNIKLELNDRAAGQQTIVHLLKGAGECIQGELLVAMHPPTAPAAACAAKSGDRVTEMPIFHTHAQRKTSREHYMNEEDCARSTAMPNHCDGQASATGEQRRKKDETGVSAPLNVRAHCAAPKSGSPISWHSAI